ncbi:MAG: TIM44-like domain-containing protein [Lactococcus cremoris]
MVFESNDEKNNCIIAHQWLIFGHASCFCNSRRIPRGRNRSTRTGGNFGGGNTTSHYHNTGSNNYSSNTGTSRMGRRYSRGRIWEWLIVLVGLVLYFVRNKVKLPFKKRDYHQEKTINDPALAQEIEEIFLNVQEAWDKQDLQSLSPFYGDKLYEKHQKVLEKMRNKGQINHTRSAILDGITRYKKIKDNQFEVDLYFVAIDYLVSIDSGQIISGNNQYRREFKQR